MANTDVQLTDTYDTTSGVATFRCQALGVYHTEIIDTTITFEQVQAVHDYPKELMRIPITKLASVTEWSCRITLYVEDNSGCFFLVSSKGIPRNIHTSIANEKAKPVILMTAILILIFVIFISISRYLWLRRIRNRTICMNIIPGHEGDYYI